MRKAAGHPAQTRRRLGAVASAAILLTTAAACTRSSPNGDAPPSTFGTASPWLGAFAPVGLPLPVNSLTALDCVNASLCWAVGSTVGVAGAPNGAAVIATTDSGERWTSQVIPPTVGYLSGVACSDQRHCTAVGQAAQTSDGQAVIIATGNGGATWTQEPTPPGILDVTAVSCEADRRCVAIGMTVAGTVALVSASAGSAWSQRGAMPAAMSGATDVSCSDDQSCWVTAHTAVDVDHVAGTVAVTTDGGSSWATVITPPGIGYLNGVSCIRGTATGSGALPPTRTSVIPAEPPTIAPGSAAPGPATTVGSTEPTPVSSTTASTAPIVGVAGARCTVVGTTANTLNAARSGHGLILTTDNGGASWTNQAVTTDSASLMDVSCPSIGSCVAVGSSVITAPRAGVVILSGSGQQPWRRPVVVGSPQPLTAVSCHSLSRCVVVGESISEHLAG